MNTLNLRRFSGVIGFVCGVVLLCFAGLQSAYAIDLEREVRFDIPAGKLADALIQFSKQAQVQVLTSGESTAAAKTDGVSGSATVRTALTRLLKSSGLSFKVMTDNAIAIGPAQASKVTGAGASPIAEAAVQFARIDVDTTQASTMRASKKEEATSGKDEEAEGEMQVTGSRIRGLVGEQSIQPVMTITSEDIERYGVSSLGEVFRYIPQVSSFELGQDIQSPTLVGTPSIDVTSNRVTATLRGAPLGGTLLLVNGRRVPKTGQAGGVQGDDAYDLSGIPLSAVERIEVVLDGASAIYGADAVGGVINVILKKDYRGTQARVNYENTFDSDVGVKTATLTHGFSAGRLSGLLNASWGEANSMMWRDRSFLRTFDRRALGGTDFRSIAGHGYGDRGVISSTSGSNLPGLTTTQAAIPAGSAGVNLTAASYANAGPLPQVFDFGEYQRYSSPYKRASATGHVEYEFGRAFSIFADGWWGEDRTWSSSIPLTAPNRLIPVGAPGNPFSVPIRVYKRFFDLPAPESHAVTKNRGITAGIRGEFAGDWRYESAVNDVRSLTDVATHNTSINTTLLAQAFAGPSPPILLYDSISGLSPNPAGALQALTTVVADAEYSRTRTYDIQADGPVFALPAGEVRISVGAEYRDDTVEFPTPQFSLSVQSNDRHTSGYFAEVRVPLISAMQGWPLMNRLEASIAVRHDRYSDFPESTNPRFGLLYRPMEWLMLRGSHGEGFKVPTLVQLYSPESEGTSFFPPGLYFDAERGGQTINGSGPGGEGLAVTFGGNPELKPERSENTTAGVVLEVPFIEGLSLSYDYYDTKYVDRVGSVNLTDHILLFPDTIFRGPKLPGDPAGWSGPVIGYEDIPFNIAVNHITGYDIAVKYHRPSERRGEWTLQATASKTTRNEIRATPNLPPTISSATFNLPLQITGALFWERGAFNTGVLCSYRSASFGSVVSGPTIPSATRLDWQGSYDFGRSGWVGHGNAWWARALADTRVNITVFNVFDTEPPVRLNSGRMPDNTVVDSRLRRYAVSVTKNF